MTTAIIRTYAAIVIEKDGREEGIGSMSTPVGEATYTFGYQFSGRRNVATANSTAIFPYADAGQRYELAAFRIIGDGTLIVSMLFDKPTNPTLDDWTPLGTQERWQHQAWTCKKGLWVSNSDVGYGLASAANEAADNGSHLPALWTTYVATMFTKKCYCIQVYNPSTTAAVEIETTLIRPTA